MADYNSFVLEGIKIILPITTKFIKEIYEPLINILCIEYYSATGIYKGSSQKTENKAR
jgi:hypothetical protein